MDSPFVAIQRGFDNVLANWPLLLIRVAENVVMMLLVVFTILAGVLPLVFFGAFIQMLEQIETPDQAAQAVIENPLILLYLMLVISVAILAAVLVHSFVQGGVVGCYLRAEKNAGEANPAERERFRVFTPELWFRDSRRSWWGIFWVYNIIWGVFGLILLVPLVALAVAMFLSRESPHIVAIACSGTALLFLLLLLAGIVTHFWSTAAVIVNVHGRGIGASLREGWGISLRRFWVFLLLALIAVMLSLVAVGSIGAASFGVGLLSTIPGVAILTLPIQVAISLLQTAVSIAVGAWFLAASVTVVLRA
jgi:hypothetical protein